MLTEYYKKYRAHGLKEPECVKLSTKEYQMMNDIYGEFVENHLAVLPRVLYMWIVYILYFNCGIEKDILIENAQVEKIFLDIWKKIQFILQS